MHSSLHLNLLCFLPVENFIWSPELSSLPPTSTKVGFSKDIFFYFGNECQLKRAAEQFCFSNENKFLAKVHILEFS